MKSLIKYIPLLLLMVFISACSDTETPFNPTEGLTKISESYAIGAGTKVELWAEQELFVGYNYLYVALYDSVDGERITKGQVQFNPLMTMGTGMKHACPVINPEDEQAVNELFPGVGVFIMPSSAMDSWKMGIQVHNPLNGKQGTATLDIIVTNPPSAHVKSFVTGSDEKIFISYTFPEDKKVGVNDFEVIVYQMVSGMEFTPVEDYTMLLEPEMPSMEHGSPNNVNPSYEKDGRYIGKVNFTMTGNWRLNLTLERAGGADQELFFDVTLD
jgi:hypothetical protein